MGRTCPSAGLWPVCSSCVLALCAHVAPSMYVAALRTFARPCCVLGVLVQFCRRTYLDSESARTTPPTAPAFSSGVSPRVRPYPARSHLVRLRLVRLRPARLRPVRHNAIAHVCIVVRLRPARSRPVRHNAIAHVCIVHATMLLRRFALYTPQCYCACLHCTRPCHACVRCVRLRPARWGVVFVQGFAYVHLPVAIVHLSAVVNVALFDIVRVDASTWLIANYIMCGIGDGA